MTAAKRLKLRCFIEGIEVPIIAASVQTTPNAPAACSIQIPPLPEGTRIFPRSIVHVFFLDLGTTLNPFPEGAPDQNSPTGQEEVSRGTEGTLPEQTVESSFSTDDLLNMKYKLFFGGEIVGFAWTKNEANRSLVLQCLDWSNYWDYAYQWNNTDLFGPGIKAMFSGGSTNLFTDFLASESEEIIKLITTPSIQYPNLKGLLGGIVHLLEAIGGSYYYGKHIKGENIFFSIAELRLHITQLITAFEDDPTASRLLNAGYDSMFGRMLGGLGQQVSIRDAINALMRAIFHETYAVPTPLYIPSSSNNPSGKTRKNLRDDPRFAYIATTADRLIDSLDSMQEALLTLDESPNQSSLMLSYVARMDDMMTTCRNMANSIRAKEVSAAKGYYSSGQKFLANAILKAKGYKPSSSLRVTSQVAEQLGKAREVIKRAAEFELVTQDKGNRPARLCQQIFRPDVWFSAPPRCNVLFPEHYTSLNYNRMFLQEPTRLLLKTNDEFFGEDELFDQFYFAPKGFTLKANRNELQDILSNDILDHELFTGILPVFEKMGELNIFAARSGSVDGKQPKIGLAQRSTNFLYFKYRFAARSLSISGKFNPYVVPGFPGLVIDKYASRNQLRLRETLMHKAGMSLPQSNALLGTHFLANFTEVMHTVDANGGGTTQYSCGYARQPEESVEFLGVIEKDQTVQKRQEQDASRVTVVSALFPPQVGSLGPNLGVITRVEDVTPAYRSKSVSGKKLPFYQGPQKSGTHSARIDVVVGFGALAKEFGQDVVSFIGDGEQFVEFKGYRVTEDVPRYVQMKVDLPAEEYIRPGWYGDVWHPSQITRAYEAFFQTGAITDEQRFQLDIQAADALASAAEGSSQDDPFVQAPGLIAVENGTSVADAVAFLVQTYSYIRNAGVDIEEFIHNYTSRPIATMVDMFGTTNLTFDSEGHQVLAGVEGFHSRAFGPYEDLFGLVTPDIESAVGIKRGSRAAKSGDTRGRKHAAVRDYVSALMFARALIG